MAMIGHDTAQDHYNAKMAGQASSGLNAQKQSPLARLLSAVDNLRKAAGLSNETAARLAGSVPRAGRDEGETRPEGGLLGSIEAAADDINFLAVSIIEDNERVNRRL